MPRRRIRLDVSYDGTEFAGSQIQPAARTVAGTLKTGLESLLKQPVKLIMAGRTDTGVHADQNVFSFDAALTFPAGKLARILNPKLPNDLLIRSSSATDSDFNPRFDAVSRTYRYHLYHSNYVPVANRRYTCQSFDPLDPDAMQDALKRMKGKHCFINFCKGIESPEDAICEIHDAVLQQPKPAESVIEFRGNRFLRHMICRIVGTLLDLGSGKVSVKQFQNALDDVMEFKPRTAPPQGLTLTKVDYPDKEISDE